jgi:ubiquinone/menaquinone biosynthesis C-methylase UbiE
MISNKELFENYHSGKNLTHNVSSIYDKNFIEAKSSTLSKYLKTQNNIILDLCCGAGDYSRIIDPFSNHYYGVDFSLPMLKEFQYSSLYNKNMQLINSDANQMPFENETFDLCFSYSSVYCFDDIPKLLNEINRVLKYNAIAILEFSTKHNINAFVSNYRAKNDKWAQAFFISYDDMKNFVEASRFDILEEKNFQFFPVLRGPWWSIIIANSFLRPLLKIKYKGKMLDERISSLKIFKKYSFKHILVLQKK